jgi:hypothetical protein
MKKVLCRFSLTTRSSPGAMMADCQTDWRMSMGKWLWMITALFFVLPGCGNDTPTHPDTFTPLTSISIEARLIKLAQGTSTQLIAKGNYSGIFTRDITSQVTWKSNQPGVADFPFPASSGRVKGLTPGDATVTATLAGVEANPVTLSVTTATLTALSIAPQLPSLPLGLSQFFTTLGAFSDTTEQDLTFDAVWESADVTVATVSNEAATKGEAIARKLGTTVIAATFAGVSASTTLIVTGPIPVAIVVKSAIAAQLTLATLPFTATGTYSDGSSRDITANVTWASSNAAVASIAANGTVKTLAPGRTVISAKLDSVEGTANFKVTGGNLQTIALTLAQAVNGVLIKGTSSRITARGTFDNNTSRDITGAVTMAVDSTNASVTPISGNLAWVQAVEGTLTTPAKISASSGSVVSPVSSLTITAPTLNGNGLTIPEQALILSNGTSRRFSLTGLFSVASTQDLALDADWSSANLAVATVGNVGLHKGQVKALTAGTTVITATYGGQTATTTVTVAARTLDTLTISLPSPPLATIAGAELPYAVTARYTDGTTQDVTADVAWSIDDANVATFSDQLSAPGLVVAVDAGTATLTAKLGEISDTEPLTVFQ